MKKIIFLALLSGMFSIFVNESANAIPHCQPCPYSCADLGLGKKDCSQASNAGGVCCVDLSSKGLALAQAREKVTGSAPAAQPQAVCPAGFNPRSQKCSPDERRRGCKDLRGSTGQTCVGW